MRLQHTKTILEHHDSSSPAPVAQTKPRTLRNCLRSQYGKGVQELFESLGANYDQWWTDDESKQYGRYRESHQ